MFALVFWIESKTTSIIDENSLRPNAEEGAIANAKYSDGKVYKAKVTRKSSDKEYLKCLKVNTEGEILKKVNITSDIMIKKKYNLKLKNKEKNKQQEASKSGTNKQILLSKSIFESDTNDSSDLEEQDIGKKFEKQRKNLEDDFEREWKGESNVDQNSVESESEHEKEREREKAKHIKERARERRTEWDREQERDEQIKKKELKRARHDKERAQANIEERERTERNRAIEQERPEEERAIDEDEEENPLEFCRRGGNGRVLLCETYNVWIDKGELTYLQRWLESPKQMTRKLLKLLVGIQNLKHMCARGRSKRTRPIATDIVNAVEYYVNKKCVHRLKPSEFTTLINMMCASLRNPKI